MTTFALKPLSKISIAVVIVAVLIVLGVGRVVSELGPWYFALKLPAWQPPGFVFPIMWSLIYLLTAISAVMTWRTIHSRDEATRFIGLFVLNCVLNVMWSALFFKLQRPDWALYQVGFFWLSILALIVYSWPRRKVAAILLLPYLIWVSIAITLNIEVVRLNGPFG